MRVSEWFGVLQDVIRQFLGREWKGTQEFEVHYNKRLYKVKVSVDLM